MPEAQVLEMPFFENVDETRWISREKLGRKSTDPELITKLKGELATYWQGKTQRTAKQRFDGLPFVKARLEAAGLKMGDDTILKQIVAPVWRTLPRK